MDQNMYKQTSAQAINRTDQQTVKNELAADVDVVNHGCAVHSEDVTNHSSDENGNQNPVRDRVFKTVCLYVSFGTMVNHFCIQIVLEYMHLYFATTTVLVWAA